MDHGSHDMGTMTTAAGAAATTAAAAAAGGHGSMGGHGCKISMLWNWNTIDSCFLSSTWKITSTAMFAGSCIGVILLVMSLELLRRSVKEFDRYLLRKHVESSDAAKCAIGGYRPKIWEQGVRALLHMVQFAVAYFVMLLAMYYNGYIIICIFIGAYIGAFVFQWETLGLGVDSTTAAKEPTVCCG